MLDVRFGRVCAKMNLDLTSKCAHEPVENGWSIFLSAQYLPVFYRCSHFQYGKLDRLGDVAIMTSLEPTAIFVSTFLISMSTMSPVDKLQIAKNSLTLDDMYIM